MVYAFYMDANSTTSPDQFTRDLVRSIRKGYKQAKKRAAAQATAQALSHCWNFDHCLDCGVSQYEPHGDVCPRSPSGTVVMSPVVDEL